MYVNILNIYISLYVKVQIYRSRISGDIKASLGQCSLGQCLLLVKVRNSDSETKLVPGGATRGRGPASGEGVAQEYTKSLALVNHNTS